MSQVVEEVQQAFTRRVESSINPSFMPEDASTWAVNVTFRGGTPQTRPGNASIFNFPCGQPQGMTMFRPTGGLLHMVVAVAGDVYVAPEPFDNYRKLENVRFYERSKFVAFADCLQSTTYDEAGVIQPLAVPRRVLVMQDGNTKPAFWDGGTDRHLDPTPSQVFDDDSGEIITQPGRDETRIGLWMAWAGNRLWVSRGPDIWASDIGNPLKFTETTYIAESRKFTMPENVTGMIQPSSGQPLIVFGENTLSFLRANVLDRTQWLDDPNFQQTEYGIGCVAPRSIINKLGLVWWYSPNGWTNLNFAMQSFNDSRVRYFDKQMGWSKRNLSVDKTGICAGETEDYTFISVPSGDKWNRHTWVWDDYQDNPGWDGVWMGNRPVQWAKGVVNGTERIFCLSYDNDGVNRVWEAMQPVRMDNQTPISCLLSTRYYNMGSGLNKRFSHAELFLREVSNDTELTAWATSPSGPAQKAMNVLLKAKRGQLSLDTTIGPSNPLQTLSRQFRELKSGELQQADAKTYGVCTIENNRTPIIDKAFGMTLAWTGNLAIDLLRVYGIAGSDNRFVGACEGDDAEEYAIRVDGGAMGEDNPYPYYTSEQSLELGCSRGDGEPVSVTATAFSMVSQRDADRLAYLRAYRTAQGLLECIDDAALLDELDEALLDSEDNVLTG